MYSCLLFTATFFLWPEEKTSSGIDIELYVGLVFAVLGFFVWFVDDSLELAKNVKQWNVKIISISKNKQHQDRTAALDVWEKLEDFVRSRSHS
nr:protein cdc73 like [Quercus suber]